MATRNFPDLLANREEQGLRLCVGLDPTYERISEFAHRVHIRRDDIFGFNRLIITATHDLMVACKLDLAFYAGMGIEGLLALEDTAALIRQTAPEVSVILDGKFGGAIAIANEGWARYAFDVVGADAVTIQCFPGADAFEPFLERTDKGIFVLCRTSNPGAGEFQDQPMARWSADGFHTPLYEYVAKQVSQEWNKNGNCGLVVGATYPRELARVRQLVGDNMSILIPGTGAQGGKLAATVKAGASNTGHGMIINFSRGITDASHGPDVAEAARGEAIRFHEQITQALQPKFTS